MLISKDYWQGAPFRFRDAPAGARIEPLILQTVDFRELDALLWLPEKGKPKVGVVAMHPRVDFTRHYTFPGLLEAGVACLGANSRNPNNDLDTVHEEIVLDVGACVALLRERGCETVILLGNSGGGSLSALYQAQATLPPADRIAKAPCGAPTRLPHAPMPPADAMIYLAPHPGQGRVLGECIDPSVTDESDPLSTDRDLDMYDTANGFAPPPAWCRYDDAFITRFRAAQRDRVRRLDAIARAHIAANREAHRASKDAGFAALAFDAQQAILRQKHADHVMVIYRTMANLHYVDERLDPSPREYGSLLSDRPDLMNVKHLGFARVCTPRAWLSTWSGESSNADMLKTLPAITAPTLFISAGADREIYPESHTLPMVEAIAARDRTVVELADAGHYFQQHRADLTRHIVHWIEERFDLA